MDSKHLERLNNAMDTTSSRRQALKLMGGSVAGGLAMAAGLKGAVAGSGETELGDSWSLSDIEIPGSVGDVDIPFSGPATLVPTNFFIQKGELALAGEVVQDGETVSTFWGLVPRDTIDVASTQDKLASVVSGRQSDVSLAQDASCDILTLNIAPIFLDVLGLQVELPNELELDIRAVPGGGNLLGNLLCAVAGLLDGNGNALGRLRNLLNQILGALGLA